MRNLVGPLAVRVGGRRSKVSALEHVRGCVRVAGRSCDVGPVTPPVGRVGPLPADAADAAVVVAEFRGHFDAGLDDAFTLIWPAPVMVKAAAAAPLSE